MKALHKAILATLLLAPAGGALAADNGEMDNGMESGKIGTANTQDNSFKAEGGTASGFVYDCEYIELR